MSSEGDRREHFGVWALAAAAALAMVAGLALGGFLASARVEPNQPEPIEACALAFFFVDFETRQALPSEIIAEQCGITVARVDKLRQAFANN